MKKLWNIGIAAATVCLLSLLNACSLKEKNVAVLSLDKSFTTRSGFEGLLNGCYNDLYFLYGKEDFVAPTELGTDLWANVGTAGAGFTLYDHRLVTTDGNLKVIWGSAYSTINLCNTVLYYGKEVKGYTSQAELNAKLAEAYFLRAFSNFILVEEFGGVVLRTTSSTVEGVDNAPKRSSEKDFYDLIISDLKFAVQHLPVNQGLRGRVSKKAAYGLLAKVYLQRTRLGEAQEYARLALETAEELINHQTQYGATLYTSDNTRSGFGKLWAGENNKTNTEFLFIQAVEHANGYNPEFWNRGRTRQFFLPDLGGRGGEWGAREGSPLYGRSNSRRFKPSRYLLTQCFEPSATTADTRFAESFTYKFYANANKEITNALATTYKKDPSVVGYVIKGTSAKATASVNFYTQTIEEQTNMANDAGLAVFTPNWTISTTDKAKMPMMVSDPSDLFDPATNKYKDPAAFPDEVNLTNVHPALKKFSAPLYAQSNQYWMGDFSIIRLGDIYLVAAEAALLYNGDKSKAAGFINTIRKRAALVSREAEQVIAPTVVDIDFILKERARELAGEHMRWMDLKRTGKLTKAYLMQTNPISGELFDASRHTVRPIPQSFLDAISNADEFGTNGY
ncbi:tetratricopeptide (TPR) repeat protein [Filimonas zeae]|uniref:Membrane protein n=1 Tax=Filimonas zeae TaxID=1737353 RepID=A0A917ILW2_9BACT|nr:RagB/SusD family nutrient uptake outer membrane protein [Filimonas zeae]MDR6337110.1 tetratricopeptide (TPR) repeat protein [Filimonas zeae]GGH57054.1 membrane protein [Filimonas zeae]